MSRRVLECGPDSPLPFRVWVVLPGRQLGRVQRRRSGESADRT